MTQLSISSLRALYKSGTATPAQVIAGIYDRIEAQPLHPIWITIVPREQALARARSLETALDLPLGGIPFAVKDNIDVAGLPTTAGCPAYAFTPQVDAFVVDRLQRAGAILVGKTNLDQFATGLVGTRSPHGACSCVFDSRYISGGSSSGSAVAVASGLVTFSLGTDTAGSGRVPAAFNNLVGLKPSRGLLSASGVVPACRSLDCVSIFALSSNDAASVLDVATGYDPEDPFSRRYPTIPARLPRQLRIGTPNPEQLKFFGNQEYKRLYEQSLRLLVEQGHSLVDIDFDPFRETAELLYAGPYVAERFAALGEFVKSHVEDVNPVVASIVTAAERWTAADAYRALYKLRALEKQTEAAWSRMDVLILPTAPTTYTIEEVQADPVKLNSRLGYYTNFANLLDLCGVAMPAGFTKAGLPFGVTVFGKAFYDKELLTFAQGTQKQSTHSILLGVVGAHLSGQPLNHQLLDRGARLVRTTKTAASYKMFALTNTKPPKPGLVKTPGFEGPGVEIEIWSMGEAEFGSFVAAVPPPLSIGTCELADGTSVKGFLCEPYAAGGMPEITSLGGWRAYLVN
jgi:allophanate hydrolase